MMVFLFEVFTETLWGPLIYIIFPLHLFDILNQFDYNTKAGHSHFCSFAWKVFPL